MKVCKEWYQFDLNVKTLHIASAGVWKQCTSHTYPGFQAGIHHSKVES